MVAGALPAIALAASSGRAGAAVPSPGSRPVPINIVDVAGNLALTQPAFEAFARENPKLVSRISFSQAPAPELPGKIMAEQRAGRLDIDLVLTGTDALSAGIIDKVWQPITPDFAAAFPSLDSNYLPEAAKMQAAYGGNAILVSFCPAGPIIEYAGDRVSAPPQTAQALAEYCKSNNGKFMYARPANSGPGRAWLMGLPYILGDKDPQDPVHGWDKTWAYLKAINPFISYYQSATTETFKQLAQGSVDVVASHMGWDVNTRAIGIVPMTTKIVVLSGTSFVVDGHFMAMPKGLPAPRQAVVLRMMQYLLQPKQQADNYDKGYFYPGPAVKGVKLSMAPQSSQDVVRKYGRPEYAKLITDTQEVLPLGATTMVSAFQIWDREIGASKSK